MRALMRLAAIVTAWLIGLLVGPAMGQEPAGATRPDPGVAAEKSSQAPQPTEFELQVFEYIGKAADLEKIEAGQTLEESEESPKGKNAPGPVAAFTGRIDLSQTSKLQVGTRVPMMKKAGGEKSVRVGYETIGAEVGISGAWQAGGEAADIHLILKVRSGSARGVAAPDTPRDLILEKNLRAPAGQPVSFRLQDKAAPIGDQKEDLARLYAGVLTVKRLAAESAGHTSQEGADAADRSSLEMEIVGLDCGREELAKLDLSKLVTAGADSERVFKTLSERGEAYQLAGLQATLSLAEGFRASTGQRVPVVQDITQSTRGVVVPSVSYEQTGAKLSLEPTRWQKSGDRWICDVGVKVEAAGIGQSGVNRAGEGPLLPTFTRFGVENVAHLQSGRPEYFIAHGPPVPPGKDGKVSIAVIRLVVTRTGD